MAAHFGLIFTFDFGLPFNVKDLILLLVNLKTSF